MVGSFWGVLLGCCFVWEWRLKGYVCVTDCEMVYDAG